MTTRPIGVALLRLAWTVAHTVALRFLATAAGELTLVRVWMQPEYLLGKQLADAVLLVPITRPAAINTVTKIVAMSFFM